MKRTFLARNLACHSLLAVLGWHSCAAEKSAQTQTFIGMCDASAAAAIDSERFIVADDEDNILRVYSRGQETALCEFDLSEFLGVRGKKKSKETDLEAAAQLQDKVFWITSHGRDSKGKDKPERQRLFVTNVRINAGKIEITPIGEPNSALLDDLVADEKLARYDLAEAAKLAPKVPGALNIEGLAATPDGRLLIGFRNPIPHGRALIVPLLNSVEACNGKPARFGPATELDLGGLGIRSMEWCAGRCVIIAGSSGEGGAASRLFEWDGKSTPKPVPGVTLEGLNPEGIAFKRASGGADYFVLSDDGTREVRQTDCKDLKDPALKQFRGRLLQF